MKVTNEEGVKHLWRRMLRRLKTKESSSNKKTSIDEYSTDADYPSAKAVYGFVNDKVEEKTAICRGTFLSQSLLPNKSICPDLKHGDYAFVNGDNNLGPNTNHYNYVETPKITLNSDTRTYTFKEQVSNEGATFPYKWGGGAGANYREVYTAVKFPGNGSKAASSYDIPVADAEYTVYDHTIHGGWVFTRALGNGAVPATHIQDTAAQSTNLAQVMKEAGAAPSGSETGEGQYGQNEINEALADPTRTKPASAVQDYVGHKTVSGTVQETELLKAYTETTVIVKLYDEVTLAEKQSAYAANFNPKSAGWYEIESGAGTEANPYVYRCTEDTSINNADNYAKKYFIHVVIDKDGDVEKFTAVSTAERGNHTGEKARALGWYVREGAGTTANPYNYYLPDANATVNTSTTYYTANPIGNHTQQDINEQLAKRANAPHEVWTQALTQLWQQIRNMGYIEDVITEWDVVKQKINAFNAYWTEEDPNISGLTIAANLGNRLQILEAFLPILSLMQLYSNNGTNEVIFKGMPRYNSGGAGDGHEMFLTGSGAPSATPAFLGQEYWDSQNRALYKGVSQTNNPLTDWEQIN